MNAPVALDWIWFLLAMPFAFGLGWLFSRVDIFHWRVESRHKPKAYFQGLNHILAGRQDQAVDAFIEAVQNDPDTAELHFTLGDLFRRRGEYARATRVHEHLIARADLSETDRARAQFALAQDYMVAGLMDRAEVVLEAQHSPEALRLKLSLFERGREWQKAIEVAHEIQSTQGVKLDKRIAHYLCEQKKFDLAIETCPTSPRAYLEKAAENSEAAFETYGVLVSNCPLATPLIAHDWIQSAATELDKVAVVAVLQNIYQQSKDLDVLRALVSADAVDAKLAMRAHLKAIPALSAAAALTSDADIGAALNTLAKKDQRYRCASCGFEAQQYFWQCPGCQAWDSYPMQKLESL